MEVAFLSLKNKKPSKWNFSSSCCDKKNGGNRLASVQKEGEVEKEGAWQSGN